MDLIVVESPTKAKHIAAMLGRGYRVLATFGHLKDLPKGELGIDLQNGFEPKWSTVRGKSANIEKIKDAAKQADRIVIATDPDREGEGIAKHVFDLLPKTLLKKVVRAEFSEITKDGVERGLKNTRALDENLADAQQARRVMDRLVGFLVSPMLWQQLKGTGYSGISAGRVQSATLHLIRQRHDEIQGFVSENFWAVTGKFSTGNDVVFFADLTHLDGLALEDHSIREEQDAIACRIRLEGMSYHVKSIECGEKRYAPPAPFVTTTLLQTASSRHGFGSKKTMKVAQELFEGAGGHHGLITYMRTDSPRVSEEVRLAVRDWIGQNFGVDLLDSDPHRHTASESAQDAHECIRPTNISLTPEKAKKSLTADQTKLYETIYWRFIMSQMAAAVYGEVTVMIHGESAGHTAFFRAYSSILRKEGWKTLVEAEGVDDAYVALCALKTKTVVHLVDCQMDKHATRPQSHYSEPTLIKALERLGIGRPSTYSTIVDTLVSREYIRQDARRLMISDLGIIVDDTLAKVFPQVQDAAFTAALESELDRIARGELSWVQPVESIFSEIRKRHHIRD